MPCYYTGTAEGDALLSTNEALTLTTRVACEMAKLLTVEQKAKLSAKALIWIKRHGKTDAKRKAR